MENTWLSIIIPIYNGEKYLYKCLRSIASQSFGSFEVLLVDDGSTDASSVICQEFCSNDSRFQYFRIKNSGPLSARLYGAKHVSGQYFTFCDADDYYINKDVLKRLFDKLSSISQDVSVIQFGYTKKYNHLMQNVSFVQKDCYIESNDFYLHEYPKLLCSFWDQSHLTCNVWNKIYSSTLLPFLPPAAERVFWGDDLILNIHLLQSIKGAYYLSDNLYVYRQSTGGTNKFSKHTMEDLDVIKKYQLQFIDKRSADDCEVLKKVLFSEIAGWFLVYLKDASRFLSDKGLQELIIHTLGLPRFKLAQQFYKDNPENWEGALLLMKGDVMEYIKSAHCKPRKTIKSAFVQVMKAIYRCI